ncbi:MAG: crotonase/enoyl-CoA hydratase family protein [SAR86 cluster bacterium]|nr:crotonase/enoyl-CoA hydratase family protein [SAR86 cluster bacterium]
MINSFATLSQEDEISIITLDDGKANVFSEEMTQAINDCLDKVPTDSGSLIITGRPGMFSAGFDLKVIASGDVPKIKKMSLSGFKLLSRIFSFPRPVVAACSGHGIALGTFLLCCCDYRIGIKGEFLLGANEMKTNMVIPTPILELIKFRISPSHKYRSILGAEMYQLDKAIDAGLMDQVEEAETLMDAAIEKAKDLATMGHPSYTLTKALFIKDVADRIDSAIKDLETQ